MYAIANVLSGMSRFSAAKLAGFDRQTLGDWVDRLNADGIEWLRDREHKWRPSALNEESRKKLAQRVEQGAELKTDGVVRWRRVDLKLWLAEECGVNNAETSVGRILRHMGFSHMSVRPIHPKGDPEAQEAFKKTLPHLCQRPFPKQPKAKPSSFGSKTKRASAKKVR
jgi:transposase